MSTDLNEFIVYWERKRTKLYYNLHSISVNRDTGCYKSQGRTNEQIKVCFRRKYVTFEITLQKVADRRRKLKFPKRIKKHA